MGGAHPSDFYHVSGTEKKLHLVGEEWDVRVHLKSLRIQTWQGNYIILNHNLENNFGALLCLIHT